MSLAAVDRSFFPTMSLVQHIRDQMLFIDASSRRKIHGASRLDASNVGWKQGQAAEHHTIAPVTSVVRQRYFHNLSSWWVWFEHESEFEHARANQALFSRM